MALLSWSGTHNVVAPPEYSTNVTVRVDPGRQLLGLGRLGAGEAPGAEHGDEQLDASQLTRTPVDQARPLAGEVDERLLAGAVHLPHRRPQPPRPLPVEFAEPGVAVAARMDLDVLLPEQLQRHAGALELAVDVRAVGPDSLAYGNGPVKQPGLERRVVQLGRQRPAQPQLGRPLQIRRDRTHADGAGLGYRCQRSFKIPPPTVIENSLTPGRKQR